MLDCRLKLKIILRFVAILEPASLISLALMPYISPDFVVSSLCISVATSPGSVSFRKIVCLFGFFR